MPWDKVMSKFKAGTLSSGGSGKKVKDRKQAIAIMMSEKKKSATNPEYKSSSVAPSNGAKRKMGVR